MSYQAPVGYGVVMDVPLQKQHYVLQKLLNGEFSSMPSELVKKIELPDPHDPRRTLELILLVLNGETPTQPIVKLFAPNKYYNTIRESLAVKLLPN